MPSVVCASCGNRTEVPDAFFTPGEMVTCSACGAQTEAGDATVPTPMFSEAQVADGASSHWGGHKDGEEQQQSSVLFRLSNLQNMARQMHLPDNEGSGLADIKLLAHMYEPQISDIRAPPPKPVEESFIPAPSISAGGASPLVAVPVTKSRPGWMMPVMIVGGLALVGVIVAVVIVVLGGKDDKPPPDKDASPPTAANTKGAMDAGAPQAAMDAAAPQDAKAAPVDAKAMEPEKPRKLTKTLSKADRDKGLEPLAEKAQECKKDRKGRFKLRIRVTGKTGKVRSVQVYPKSRRKTKTGKCLIKLFKTAQFYEFKRRSQSFYHTVRIK